MGGGLMQLVAYGAQDVYLSGNPQITFFKVVYRRHTNFSVEPIQQTWNGAADFGRTVTCNINRNGDAISNMYLAVKLAEVYPAVAWGYVNRVGHAMVEETKVEIGGSKIDEQYGDWLNIWYELTHVVGQERGYAKMVGDVPNLTEVSTARKRAYQLYVPLQYWFNRNNGLALPLIALQYHDVRITVKFRDATQCVNWAAETPVLSNLMADSYLLIDYIYLDSEERKRFAQASHEYLIEQLQFTGSESLTSATNKYRLNFNHPSKYLVWAPHLDLYAARNSWIAYAFDGDWAAAKDRFAKLIAVAASNTVTYTAAAGSPLVAGSITVVLGAAPTVGDLVEPSQSGEAASGIPNALLAKVEVKMVALTAAATCKIASGDNDDEILNDLLNNCIVTRNELTMEDLSYSLADLSLGSAAGPKNVLRLATLSVINHHNYGNFLDGSDNPVASAKLQLNGHDRFQARDGNYFNYVQPAQHFPNTPADGINVYSFALKAVDHQPTGTCNFSRIDNATLQVDCGLYNATGVANYAADYLGANSNTVLNIYTVNYNVLRVMSGMAGTAYSN